jgi:hypothetical protein
VTNLIDELGLDPQDFQWQDLALCSNMPTSFFYDQYETDKETAKAVDEACLRCPVIKQCFFAGAENQHGVWGGVYWNGSGKPDNNRNSHKNEKTWSEIQRRVE